MIHRMPAQDINNMYIGLCEKMYPNVVPDHSVPS